MDAARLISPSSPRSGVPTAGQTASSAVTMPQSAISATTSPITAPPHLCRVTGNR
jgi:hypothetical protein